MYSRGCPLHACLFPQRREEADANVFLAFLCIVRLLNDLGDLRPGSVVHYWSPANSGSSVSQNVLQELMLGALTQKLLDTSLPLT